jgi:hypothetical protein
MMLIDVRLAPASGSEAALSNCSKQQPLLDHLVGAREQRRRNFEAESVGGLEVDH